jgi:hypothetical protein
MSVAVVWIFVMMTVVIVTMAVFVVVDAKL